MFRSRQIVTEGNKGKPVHTGLYLVRKGMRLDGATLSLFIARLFDLNAPSSLNMKTRRLK